MADRVVEDLDAVKAWLAQQPLCQWLAEKQRKIDQGIITPAYSPTPIRQPEPQQSAEDAEFMDALSKMC